MSEHISFRQFAEFKEITGSLADSKGGKPNQDIPTASKFKGYLQTKDSLAGRDYDGDLATNPVKGSEENPLPYKSGEVENPGVWVHDEEDPKSGFAFKAGKSITPTNAAPKGKSPEMKVHKVPFKHKLTAEQFIEQTKNLSPKEFVDFFCEGAGEPLPTVTDLYGNEFTPDPTQVVEYLAALVNRNPKLMSRFVREIKRQEGGMGGLMAEVQDHPEFYTMLVEGMTEPEEGKRKCGRIARAMNEDYMKKMNNFVIEHYNEEVIPRHEAPFEQGGDALGKTPSNPSGQATPKMKPQTPGGAIGGGSGPNVPPPDMNLGGSMGGGGGPGMAPPDEEMGGAMGGGAPNTGGGPGMDAGMPGTNPGAMMPPGSGGGAGQGGGPPPMPPGGQQGGEMPDFGDGQLQPPTPKGKYMGETAHGNMISELGGYPDIRAHMHNFCINPPCKN